MGEKRGKMAHRVIVGNHIFESKKKAGEHFKTILNKYDFNEKLTDKDFEDVRDLVEIESPFNDIIPRDENYLEPVQEIKEIRIAKLKYNTKCFELVFEDGSTKTISYIYRINQPQDIYHSAFIRACRAIIQTDLRNVKQEYFHGNSKKGEVKCQETGILSKWEDLVVDHRQPNTFSVIIDRFIELNNLDIAKIEYIDTGGEVGVKFLDEELEMKFRKYHKGKALLRVVRKSCNSSRATLGRNKKQGKDLQIQ